MQLVTVKPGSTQAVREVPAPAPAPAIRNVHLMTSAATDFEDRTTVRSLYVPFDVERGERFGGHVSMSTIVNDRVAGISLRAFVNRNEERAAAQAVLDAVTASGLLAAKLPANDWQRPAVGVSRLYLDRRSRFLEFDAANPPATVQGILDALRAYEAIGRRGAVASAA